MAQISNTTGAWDSQTNKLQNTQRASGMPDISNKGGHHLAQTTTNVSVWSNGMKVGFIQSASPSESREIVKVQELGAEGVIQSVPSNTNGGQISVSRLAVYNGNLFNALGLTRNGNFVSEGDQDIDNRTSENDSHRTFGNPFKTLKDQRVPLELQIKLRLPDADKNKFYVETYLDCWLSSYSKTVASNTITITEQATIQYSDVRGAYTN